MNAKDKQEWAQLLYIAENLTQAEIAEKVGVSRNTVNTWCKKFKWEELKAGYTITREQQLQRLYIQIAAINKAIADREQKYPSSSEADAINKLAAAIDKLERESSLSDIISVTTKFLNWLRPVDLTKAKEISGWFDAFIKDTMSK